MRSCLPAVIAVSMMLVSSLTACPEPAAGGGRADAGAAQDAGVGSDAADAGVVPMEPFDPSPVPLESACETWALAQCRGEARCHEIPARYIDVCADENVKAYCGWRFESGVNEGFVEYDAAAWGRCLARLSDEAHCSTVLYQNVFLWIDEDCRVAFRGKVQPGQPCSESAWCQYGSCDEFSQCGRRCVHRGQPDEACNGDGECDYGYVCADGRCQGRGGFGAPCTWEYPSFPTPQCQAGLFCLEGTCVPPLPAGAACREYDLPCDAGLVCDWRTKSCVAPPGPGEPCDNADSEPCRHDLGCDIDRNICVEGRGPGEPCIAGLTPWRNNCALVFQCFEESFRKGHCARGPDLGDACEADGKLRCEGSSCTNGICTGQTATGWRCDVLHPCDTGDVCKDGFCLPGACVSR